MSEAVDQLLGGGGHPACTFPEKGRTYEGVIVDDRYVQAREYGTREPKLWPSGDPMMISVFDLQTEERDPSIEDDDGIRSLYVDKRNMRAAIADALREAGVKRGESVQGGTLKVRFTGFGEGANPQNPPKMFRAKFTKGSLAAAAVMEDEYVTEFIDGASEDDESPF